MSKQKSQVDFFIVGSLKSGSTSLDRYLQQHPEIYMSPVKDKPYYGKDLYPYLTKEEYQKLYDKAKDDQIIGETNTWYLYSKSAAKEIKKDHPNAKILILLRNPVDFLHSYHSEMCFGILEEEKDFGKALALEKKRKLDYKKKKRDYWGRKFLYYSDVASFSGQIEKYYKTFGQKNVKVVLFDDLVKDTPGIYEKIIKFIGVYNVSFKPNFKIYNQAKVVKNPGLQRWITKPPKWLNKIVYLIPFKLRYSLLMLLFSLNSRKSKKALMSKSLRNKLDKQYRQEVKKLEKLLHRDLSFWY